MKALTVRFPDDLNERFTQFCRKKGYKKGGLILSLIDKLVEHHEKTEHLDPAKPQVYRPSDRDPLSGIARLFGKGVV